VAQANATRTQHLRDIHFTHCFVRIWHRDYLETIFGPDKKACALFDYSPASCVFARSLGYISTWQMHADHDLLHTFLAQEQGLPYSPTLAHVAGVDYTPDADREAEEGRVLAFQRYLQRGIYDELLDVFDDPYGLAQVFKSAYRLRDPLGQQVA
jgi:hypothetical protein